MGLEVVKRVRGLAGTTPIVVLTGLGDERLARQCLEHGAQDFVRKGDLDGYLLIRAIEHSRARERARDLERQLESADRLATLGQLAANVAHEVNNPATFVQLNNDELLTVIEELLEQRGIDGPLGGALEEMRALLEENRTGIRPDRRPRPRSPGPHQQRRPNRLHCGRQRAVPLDLQPRLTPPQGPGHAALRPCSGSHPGLDPGRLGQVLMNLLINASQAGAEGDPQLEVCVATRYREGWLELNVSDTGVGIAPEHRRRIFEPFFTTKPAEKGTGLGLSICRDLIETMGGTITVAAGPVRGSVFSIRVPARPAAAPQPTEPSFRASPRKRVLLVDDDRTILRTLTRALAPYHDVTPANGGHEALLKAAQQQFDVIVCDLVMPEMDGVQLIEELCSRYPEYTSRVCVLSGGATTIRTATFVEESGIPQLTKPASVRDLRSMIEEVTRTPTGSEAARR